MTKTGPEIHGECDDRFAAVREQFEANFRDYGESGAAVSVTLDGVPVVDLWGGLQDRETNTRWQRDTITCVYSSTKGMGALAMHILADRGLIDLDAPVATYWPEFAQAGKANLLVKWLLSHQAGLPAVDGPLPPGGAMDMDYMVRALERQAPFWEPGTKRGYHAITYGILLGEIVRRVTGRTMGQFFRDEVATPLGVDFFIGTPASEDHRVASMIYAEGTDGPTPYDSNPAFRDPNSLSYKAVPAMVSPPGNAHVNTREWRIQENAAMSGHGNARALARIYGALSRGGEVDGVRLLRQESVDRARQLQVEGADEMVMKGPAIARQALGYGLPQPDTGDVRGPNAFGHGGAGGSLGFADPDARIGFGYTMTKMWRNGTGAPDVRAASLTAAVYKSL